MQHHSHHFNRSPKNGSFPGTRLTRAIPFHVRPSYPNVSAKSLSSDVNHFSASETLFGNLIKEANSIILQPIPLIPVVMIIAVLFSAGFLGCGKVEAPEEALPPVQQIDGNWVDWDLYDTVDLLTMTLYRNDERPAEPVGHVMYDSLAADEQGRWNEYALWEGAMWDRVIFLRRLTDDVYFSPTGSDSSYTPQQKFDHKKGTIWVDLSTYLPWETPVDEHGWMLVRPWIVVRIGYEHYYRLHFAETPRRFRIIEY